jgi:hypothetical protein
MDSGIAAMAADFRTAAMAVDSGTAAMAMDSRTAAMAVDSGTAAMAYARASSRASSLKFRARFGSDWARFGLARLGSARKPSLASY